MTEKTFAERLIEARKAAGLSQSQLAGKALVPVSTIQGLEQGRRQPGWAMVQVLAIALGVDCKAFQTITRIAKRQPTRQTGKRDGGK